MPPEQLPAQNGPAPVRRPQDWPHALAICLGLLALYLYTAPRTVVFEDDGLFILSSWFLGIEHPPGFPVYVLLGNLATLLPFGSPAWRVHALSGLFAALACVFVYRIARQLLPGQAPAWLAAVGFGLSKGLWSQAIIADVYSLNALICFALLDLALREWRSRPQGAPRLADQPLPAGDPAASLRRALLSALLLGLGLANHWPLLVLCGPALALPWLASWRLLLRWSPLLLLALALGLSPYLWLIWRSWQLPVVSFYGPLNRWEIIAEFLLRLGYRELDASPTAGGIDRALFLALIPRLAAQQLLPVGGLLALVGLFAQWRRWGRLTAGAVTLTFLGPTVLLVLLRDWDYHPFNRIAFEAFPVVAWGALALWAALGLVVGSEWLARRGWWRWPATTPALAAALLVAIGASHWAGADRHGDRFAERFARALLAQPEPGAPLLVTGDFVIPTTGYLHMVLGERPDLRLHTETAGVLEPRLFDPLTTPLEARQQIIDEWIASEPGPVWRQRSQGGQASALGWLLSRIEPGGDSSTATPRYRLDPAERDLLLWLADQPPQHDGTNEILRRDLLVAFVGFQTQAELAGQWPGDDGPVAAARARALALPEVALARAQLLFAADPMAHASEIDQLLGRFAAAADDPGLSKRQFGQFYWLMAMIASRQGQLPALRAAVGESLRNWPDPDNPAHQVTGQLRALDEKP